MYILNRNGEDYMSRVVIVSEDELSDLIKDKEIFFISDIDLGIIRDGVGDDKHLLMLSNTSSKYKSVYVPEWLETDRLIFRISGWEFTNNLEKKNIIKTIRPYHPFILVGNDPEERKQFLKYKLIGNLHELSHAELINMFYQVCN